MKNYKNMLCTNCGVRGHILRECEEPITSFGIIAYVVVNNKEEEVGDINDELTSILSSTNVSVVSEYPKIKLLLIQRKDTIGYTDFVRGKYKTSDKIKMCFSEMTIAEQEYLVSNDFDYIWNTLWLNHHSKTYRNEYEHSKRKFNQCDIPSLVEEYPAKYNFSEFGFPKGRRNIKEGDIECAIREFSEESGYYKGEFTFIDECIVEDFVGTDNVNYKHVYYIAKMNEGTHKPFFNEYSKSQVEEIKNIGYFDVNESLALLRPYDTEKKRAILDTVKVITKYECLT